jgi:hypothetical protein
MIERDFTFKKYQKLCKTIIDAEFETLCVKDYLSKSGDNFIILRHDVDRMPESALKMAEIESEKGINSTFFFRINDEFFSPEIIKKVSSLGHEIGYHYEVLDKAKGDKVKAMKLFKEELEKLRSFVDVKTIACHGNPISPYNELEIWQNEDFREFGIIGDTSISIDYNEVLYFGDIGRTWNGRYSVKDLFCRPKGYNIKKTEDIIKLLKNRKVSKACLVVHPNRWNDNYGPWFKELFIQKIKNIGKLGIIHYRDFKGG